MRLTRLVVCFGLLVVAAISVAAGSGRKPARPERAMTSVRVLTDVETDQLGRRFSGLWARTKVTGELLERLFPNTAFYKALYHYGRPYVPYLTSVSDTSLLSLPSGFNRLLRVYNMEVNDKNKVELAKAFVLMAVGDAPVTDPQTGEPGGLDSFPTVTFVDANVTERRMGLYTFNVELKVKTGGQAEEWHFATLGSHQFCSVLRRDAKGNTIQFYDLPVVPFPPSQGQLDPTPNMVIETSPKAVAQAERDSLGTGLASGRKLELENTAGSARMLTDAEAAQVSQRFPVLGVRPGGISLVRDDLLDHLFPKTVFYRILHGGRPPSPYLISVTGDSVFPMPSGFNLLLREQGIEVSDDNIIDLAKAFVIIAIANRPPATLIDEFSPLDFIPRITFLGEQRIEQRDLRNPCAVDAQITCRIGSGDTQTWRFSQGRDRTSEGVRVKVGQFGAVRVAIGAKPIWVYQPVSADDETRR